MGVVKNPPRRSLWVKYSLKKKKKKIIFQSLLFLFRFNFISFLEWIRQNSKKEKNGQMLEPECEIFAEKNSKIGPLDVQRPLAFFLGNKNNNNNNNATDGIS